jgi:hypothetical protein
MDDKLFALQAISLCMFLNTRYTISQSRNNLVTMDLDQDMHAVFGTSWWKPAPDMETVWGKKKFQVPLSQRPSL